MSDTINASTFDAKLNFLGSRVRGDIDTQRRLAEAMQYLAELLLRRLDNGGNLKEYPLGPVYNLSDSLLAQHTLLMREFKDDTATAEAIDTLYRVLAGLQEDDDAPLSKDDPFGGSCSGCGGCNC